MAQTASERSSSLHRSTSSTPGYFEFNPSTQSDTALIQEAMDVSNVHRLDAFHERPSTSFEFPENAHIYAARPLPPVPAPLLRKPSSVRSLKAANTGLRRPSLTSKDRTVTTDCIERPLPPLPLRAAPHHRRGLSIESVASSKISESEAPIRRPRAMRSISFRNFLNRNTYPQPDATETLRTSSSLSQNSDSTRDSRHDSIVDDMGLSLSKATTPTSSAPGSRRPSTLSLASLRSRKISQDSVPALPTPRPVSRKESHGASSKSRWALFGSATEKNQIVVIDDSENIAPTPITPPGNTELSCHRCYYFSMRNCNGWVMGGSHGDACENCTMHGFFGSP